MRSFSIFLLSLFLHVFLFTFPALTLDCDSAGNCFSSPSSSPVSSPSSSPVSSPSSSPSSFPSLDPSKEECKDCDNKLFKGSPNFLTYASDKFKGKFPFDVIGSASSSSASSASSCPKFKLWDNEREFCFIRDTFKLLKYPTWVTFMIKLVISA